MSELRYNSSFSTDKTYFSDTSFEKLMQKRIINVLLVCSNYDAFMLEEDGRIDEQIFNEYTSLNLRYPPQFVQVSSADEALDMIEHRKFDLVILMLSIEKEDTFGLAKKIKILDNNIPIVVLTHFTRKVSEKIAKEDLSSVDYVFCWLGNTNLILAIVKLIEDNMNAENDINEIGTQAILLVEDSIRYYSSYLPNIYRVLLAQSDALSKDTINYHQNTRRKRGRPKLLLANTFEQALDIYEKYKSNLLGIISDISYKYQGVQDKEAGIKFCKLVRNENSRIPFVLQSSDIEFKDQAIKLNAQFIYKYSKTIIKELTDFLLDHMLFGEFIFRNPNTMDEIARAADLKDLQCKINVIPDDTIAFHAQNDHFSKWLKTRSMFSIAKLLESKKYNDFKNAAEIKAYIADTITNYRIDKSRGQIAKFNKENFDNLVVFSRIGDGSIGGKARGLAFIDSILKKYQLLHKYEGVVINIPNTVVLATDIFDEFMNNNRLYPFALSQQSDDAILTYFISGKFSDKVTEDLKSFLAIVNKPIAVRSSSLLEDSYYQPFAGIYSTYMIPNNDKDLGVRLLQLEIAIKSVYASVFFKESKSYMAATSSVIDEEKMAIVLQEVTGNVYNDKYYPSFSGVGRSINFYPIAPEQSNDGVVNIALGLGKTIVDGGVSLRFSPKFPKKIMQLYSVEMTLKSTQKEFFALNLKQDSFKPSSDEGANLLKLDIKEAEKDCSLDLMASTYDFQNNVIRDGYQIPGLKLITFSQILNYDKFPLSEILNEMLSIGQEEMNCPVEIEFAVNLDVKNNKPKIFNFLQIRPIVQGNESSEVNLKNILPKKTIIMSESALGNGIIDDIYDFVYVKPTVYDPSNNQLIAKNIANLNEKLFNEGRRYILVGPGRWGSSDHWLGIPVKWAQISAARVIVESGLTDYRIDPSQGTHFFQNLTTLGVGYFTINPFIEDGFYDLEFLDQFKPEFEDEFIRHIQFISPLIVKIDGKHNSGVIFKPENI